MNPATSRTILAAAAVLASAASGLAAGPMTAVQQAEFQKLVHQRNALYTQLSAAGNEAFTDATRTTYVQSQLDTIEQRLGVLATEHDLEVPPRPVQVPSTAYGDVSPFAVGDMSVATPKQKAEFNKLVLRRNKLHIRLSLLDKQAAELIKRGHDPVVVHAQQVSALDELDLIELQLAMLATRYELTVPPVPGRDPLPGGQIARPDDEANRNLDQAFARGRDRAMKLLQEDADRFMYSLDFEPFINY